MKRKAPKEQLGLWDTIADTTTDPPAPSTEQHQDEPPVSMLAPSQDTAPFLDNELWNRCQRQPLHIKERDIEAMRTWLLLWGKRNGYPAMMFPFGEVSKGDHRVGLTFEGVEKWEADIQARGLSGHYVGEWLVKCIAYVRRVDSGELPAPWKAQPSKSTEPRQDRDEDD